MRDLINVFPSREGFAVNVRDMSQKAGRRGVKDENGNFRDRYFRKSSKADAEAYCAEMRALYPAFEVTLRECLF